MNQKEIIKMGYFYSNEIVFRGHPDKVCDQISFNKKIVGDEIIESNTKRKEAVKIC